RGTSPHEICTVHRPIAVDVRNGLLAGADCPQEFVVRRVFTFYQPEYYEWALGKGLEIPPVEVSPLCGLSQQAQSSGDNVQIIFPDDGDLFAIDPSVPAKYRSIIFRAAAPQGTSHLRWIVDGKTVGSVKVPYSFAWQVRKGRHRLVAAADNIESQQVVFTVK
ncbi:MAG: hypothetical protein AB1546_12265, partial [bacterium]